MKGKLAIIIDDLGYDAAAARELLALEHPLTLAVLPHTPRSTAIAQEVHRRGREVLLHLPMQSQNGEKREAIELYKGMDAAELARTVDEMLASVPHARGVNNHQGSLATADGALMNALMADLRRRGLFFVDSRTAPGTRAYGAARRAGVPAATRDIFLDDIQTPEAVTRQLELAAAEAIEKGHAVAIGHPYPVTIAVLREALPQLAAHGVRLVFVSELVQ